MIDESTAPIFIQIKERLKDDIMAGVYEVDELIISTTQISKLYSVNPATAVKSVSMLVDEGIVYKKRGIGMCVAVGAKETIVKERVKEFHAQTIPNMVKEAKKLCIEKSELIKMVTEVKDYD
ncbi:MAG: GntR family transcriptional regulator [Eubacteriales bacterium]|nr:GntR family transcriptional regulator [Eubacteriales bacterium]MDD4513778.1 GntR family transcriptional regulator [Eubacteriales bacterium]